MKGDFSRRTFDRDNRYSAVLQEQGRVLSDADLDEQNRIHAYRIETEAADLIGGCGGPIDEAGFEISSGGDDLRIGPGRYYVDGILVENDDEVDITDQPDLPEFEWPPAGGSGRYLAYLDVWRRVITSLDDPTIREVALGGPTTSVREKTIWQVRLAEADAGATCLTEFPEMDETTGTLAVQADPEEVPTDPCDVPLSAGFKGLENQFYRFEVLDAGSALDVSGAADLIQITGFGDDENNVVVLSDVGALESGDAVEYGSGEGSDARVIAFAHIVDTNTMDDSVVLTAGLPAVPLSDNPWLRRVDATFVWSRDNGFVVTSVEHIDETDPREITLGDLGQDAVLGFAPGQWVHLSDDRDELDRRPRQLLRVDRVDPAHRIITLKTPADVNLVDMDRNPRLRRWDGARGVTFNSTTEESSWISIEDGIQVRFTEGEYVTGDYWHVAARTASIDPSLGSIEWPLDESGDPALLPPHGVSHHYCRLGMLDLSMIDDETGPAINNLTDCRNLFPPVTELTNLLYVGGDGQSGVPDPSAPDDQLIELEAPLQVRVANGSFPVVGAQVQFEITTGNGALLDAGLITTDDDGIANCTWEIDSATSPQHCRARLRDAAGDLLEHQIVNFHATLSTADRVAYDPANCQNLTGTTTVQEAIDRLCRLEGGGGGRCCCVVVGPEGDFETLNEAIETLLERGETDICICLLPGDHVVRGLSLTASREERETFVKIAGCGPGTRIHLADTLRMRGLGSVLFRDLTILAGRGVTMTFTDCDDVTISGCEITGVLDEGSLIQVQYANSFQMCDNMIESVRQETFRLPTEILSNIELLSELFPYEHPHDFSATVRQIAPRIAELNQGQRTQINREITNRLEQLGRELTFAERTAYESLARNIGTRTPRELIIVRDLEELRLATVRSAPGTAIEIDPLPESRDHRFERRASESSLSTLENNNIIGVFSIYGPADPEQRMISPSSNQGGVIRERIRGLDVRVEGGLGTIQLRGNHLTRIAYSTLMADRLESIGTGEGRSFGLVFDDFFVADNIIQETANQILAAHVFATGNNFKRLGNVASVVGDTGIYTGNYGSITLSDDVRVPSLVYDYTRASTEAANLDFQLF